MVYLGWSFVYFVFGSGRGNVEEVVFEGGKGAGCAAHECVLLCLLSSITIWVMAGSSFLVRVYRS
jgi:hypothetical protein